MPLTRRLVRSRELRSRRCCDDRRMAAKAERMKTIIVTTQAELDALPERFEEYTVIEIRADADIWIRISKVPKNGHAELWGSSHAVLWGSSHAVLRESSHAELWGSSHA